MINLHLQRTHGNIKHRRHVRWQMAYLLLPAISACVGYGCQKGPNPFTFLPYQLAAACPKHKNKSLTPHPWFMVPQCSQKHLFTNFSQISRRGVHVAHARGLQRHIWCVWLVCRCVPHLAQTAKYLWQFITGHTNSLGRKLILVLALRLTAPQAHVRHHIASVLSCSIWRPAVIRLLYDRQSQFRTSHKAPPRSFSKLGVDQINLEARSLHRFTWQMRPAPPRPLAGLHWFVCSQDGRGHNNSAAR